MAAIRNIKTHEKSFYGDGIDIIRYTVHIYPHAYMAFNGKVFQAKGTEWHWKREGFERKDHELFNACWDSKCEGRKKDPTSWLCYKYTQNHI